MAKVLIDNNSLKISLTLFEKIRALSPSLNFDLKNVRGATDDSSFIKDGLGLRAPGTGFPGLIAEGTFYKKGDRIFALWHKGQQVVVVELQNSFYDRLAIGCKDAKKLAKEINAAIN